MQSITNLTVNIAKGVYNALSNYRHYKRRASIALVVIVSTLSLINNIPSSVLAKIISYYSFARINLVNSSGTIFNGSGLLIVNDVRHRKYFPLSLISWHLHFGVSKIIAIDFTMGDALVAQTYLNWQGVNLDNLNLSLSIDELSQLFDIIRDMALSGEIRLSTQHILLSKEKQRGSLLINCNNLSSLIAPVNPLGSYAINLDLSRKTIAVTTTNANATLYLNGNGFINGGLNLQARVANDKKDKMAQFMVLMGTPNANGGYLFKVF